MRHDDSGRHIVPSSVPEPEYTSPHDRPDGDETVSWEGIRNNIAPEQILRKAGRHQWWRVENPNRPFRSNGERDRCSYMLECRHCGTRPTFPRDDWPHAPLGNRYNSEGKIRCPHCDSACFDIYALRADMPLPWYCTGGGAFLLWVCALLLNSLYCLTMAGDADFRRLDAFITLLAVGMAPSLFSLFAISAVVDAPKSGCKLAPRGTLARSLMWTLLVCSPLLLPLLLPEMEKQSGIWTFVAFMFLFTIWSIFAYLEKEKYWGDWLLFSLFSAAVYVAVFLPAWLFLP